MTLHPDTRIFIAGHRGLVGSALVRHFTGQGFHNLIVRTSTECDLRDPAATDALFAETKPEVVIDAAGKVGGIVANDSAPADFFSDNIRMQVSLLDSAVTHGVQRFLFLGSSCIYPRDSPRPIPETALLAGPLEETNEAYAMAKLAGVFYVRAIRRQFGLPYICAMPTNLYGPGDNFHPHTSHVLPAMIRRFHEAAEAGAGSVTCWGSGLPRREFLHVDDLAAACHFLIEHYDSDVPINVGSGTDVTIAELADMTAAVTGYRGRIEWDPAKPDGTYQKLLDVSRINQMGWSAKTALDEGIGLTYRWFLEHSDDCRR